MVTAHVPLGHAFAYATGETEAEARRGASLFALWVLNRLPATTALLTVHETMRRDTARRNADRRNAERRKRERGR